MKPASIPAVPVVPTVPVEKPKVIKRLFPQKGEIHAMFTCAKIRDGGSYLGNHLTANDYYCKNENVIGQWIGKAAERLDLDEQPIIKGDTAFEALRRNRIPDGRKKLTPLRNDNGVRFFDFQCSAQKSVSIMAVVMKDRRLYEAHDRAAATAFAELERFAAFRSGKSREPEISGNLCAAAFRHDASRALDPQIYSERAQISKKEARQNFKVQGSGAAAYSAVRKATLTPQFGILTAELLKFVPVRSMQILISL